MSFINLAGMVDVTEAEGPGLRAAIWVQGCLKRCPGCCNPHFLAIRPAQISTPSDIIERILHAKKKYHIEGITLLGGEPFLQAQGLAEVAESAQAAGLSVMVFTGYVLEELVHERFAAAERLLAATDVLVDGEYERDQSESQRNWVGSTNQRFHYLTNFYDNHIEAGSQTITNEWRIDANGKIIDNGLPYTLKLHSHRTVESTKIRASNS
jgi:anaerobic ribonucleoside-triphosphate reductase activating protein